MNKKVEVAPRSSSWDASKWTVIIILIVAAVWANYHYSQIEWPIRVIAWIVLAAILLAIASQTVAGRQAWEFSKGARAELRKVVWPTRQETIRTTMVVVAMVIIMALILWGIDSFLLWIMSLLTGGRP